MKHEDILKAARDRMTEAVSFDRENREAALSDLEFLSGKHWPDKVKTEREAENRPCLTINRLPQFVRGVTGDIRRMNPAINVQAADSDASGDVADVIEGMVRHIEYSSNASSTYELAATDAAQNGIGYWRILSEYEDEASFNQVLKIKRIHNTFSVYMDPAAREATREDAQYCFISEQMSDGEYKRKYPNAGTVDVSADGVADGMENWHIAGKVVVAEYFWKERVTKKIGLMADGRVVEDPKPPMDFVKERTVNTHKVMWAKISGSDVLEEPREFPCKHIPVVAVVGEEIYVGEKVVRSSVIRHAKDPAQLYNYWSSADAELVALQPKAPYIGTKKQFEGLEDIWAAANDSNEAFLYYNPDEKAPGPPQRAQPPVSSAGMAQQAMKAVEDMKATTGIYDAGLGNKSNEQSGVAIRQRQMESDVANSIYSDNLAKSIAYCGRILVDMIPKIYDTKRIVRVLGKNDTEKLETINVKAFELGVGPVDINNLNLGKYDVRVSVGPNYSTRRQETSESMMNFVKQFPESAGLVGDLIADAMDWPNKDQFVERLRKTLPPEMREQEDMSPEDQEALAAASQAQQEANDLQQQGVVLDLKKQAAETQEAEADAAKAGLEVEEKQLELAQMSGEMNDAISALVQQEVTRALQSVLQQGSAPLI